MPRKTKPTPAIGPSLSDLSALGVWPRPQGRTAPKVPLRIEGQLPGGIHVPPSPVNWAGHSTLIPNTRLAKDRVREESTRHGHLRDQLAARRIEAQPVQSEIEDPHCPIRSPLPARIDCQTLQDRRLFRPKTPRDTPTRSPQWTRNSYVSMTQAMSAETRAMSSIRLYGAAVDATGFNTTMDGSAGSVVHPVVAAATKAAATTALLVIRESRCTTPRLGMRKVLARTGGPSLTASPSQAFRTSRWLAWRCRPDQATAPQERRGPSRAGHS